MAKKVFLATLGCTKNLVDSEVMLFKLKSSYQLTDSIEDADILIVNSCGFISSAKEETIQTIFELNNLRKDKSKLILTGCLSERYKKEIQNLLSDEVDLFSGVCDYNRIDKIIDENINLFSEKTFLIQNENRVITGSISHVYIKISEGCNQNCSFCAIPNFKGRLQSRNLNLIYDEVQNLTKQGYFDFSFISQDSSSYGKDLQTNLIDLITKIEKIEGVKSARILYLYPATTSLKLIETIGKSKVFHNYFDIPLQHISNKMLKVMKRGGNRNLIENLLSAIRKLPNSYIRTAFIIGHPEESNSDFNELLEFIKNFRFDMISVFEYSDEEGTKSFNLKNKIPKNIIEQRLNSIEKLISIQKRENLLKYIGKEFIVTIEREDSYLFIAKKLDLTPEIDIDILINDKEIENIDFHTPYLVKITELAGFSLIGTILKKVEI